MVNRIIEGLRDAVNGDVQISRFRVEKNMAELSGFTLFRKGTTNKWQLSTRLKGEDGWNIRVVDEATARALFDRLKDIDAPSAKPVSLEDAINRLPAKEQEAVASRTAELTKSNKFTRE